MHSHSRILLSTEMRAVEERFGLSRQSLDGNDPALAETAAKSIMAVWRTVAHLVTKQESRLTQARLGNIAPGHSKA